MELIKRINRYLYIQWLREQRAESVIRFRDKDRMILRYIYAGAVVIIILIFVAVI